MNNQILKIENDVARLKLASLLKDEGLDLGPCVGSGSFGSCYKVYKNNSLYAVVKLCKISFQDQSDLQTDPERSINKEFDILTMLDNKHIVKIINDDSEKKEPKGFSCLVHDYNYFLMEPLFPLSKALITLVPDWKKLYGPETLATHIGMSISNALYIAETNKAITSHKDVKPGNILVRLDWLMVKDFVLSDFGIANKDCVSMTFGNSIRGEDKYCYPEKVVTEKSDVYSLGIILAEILNLDFPGRVRQSKTVRHTDYGELGRVVKMMISINPADRPTVKEICDFFTQEYKKYSPGEKRINDMIKNSFSGLTDEFSRQSDEMKDTTIYRNYRTIKLWNQNEMKQVEMVLLDNMKDKTKKDYVSRLHYANFLIMKERRNEAREVLTELYDDMTENGMEAFPIYDCVLASRYGLGMKLTPEEKNAAMSVIELSDEDLAAYAM